MKRAVTCIRLFYRFYIFFIQKFSLNFAAPYTALEPLPNLTGIGSFLSKFLPFLE